MAVVLNLADSNEKIEVYCEAEDFDTDYYRSLYEAGKVIALSLSADFFSDTFVQLL